MQYFCSAALMHSMYYVFYLDTNSSGQANCSNPLQLSGRWQLKKVFFITAAAYEILKEGAMIYKKDCLELAIFTTNTKTTATKYYGKTLMSQGKDTRRYHLKFYYTGWKTGVNHFGYV